VNPVQRRRGRAGREIDACEERFRAVVEMSNAGVWMTDAEGNTTSVDDRVCRMLGYRPGEMEGRPLSDFVVAKEQANGSGQSRRRRGDEQEVELRRNNGETVNALLSSKSLYGGGTELSGTLMLVSEAAERKQAEAETELLKNEFFALVSHELRTPITSMVGYLDLITETQSERMDEQGLEFLDVIRRNTNRLSTLLADLMLLTQVDAGNFAMECDLADINALATSSIEEARPTAENAGIELTLSAGEKFACWGDGNRLGQVLDNLILNAIKFTPSGGHVEVRILERGDSAVIEVDDDGPGIPAAEHQELFSRFYQGSDARARQVQGLGLGLAITKAIVDAHSGKINLVSSPETGTTFTVELPRQRPSAGSPRWVKTSAVRKTRTLVG
jgi:PAS domain S-box-containing protein